jgi:hypothetical protein
LLRMDVKVINYLIWFSYYLSHSFYLYVLANKLITF